MYRESDLLVVYLLQDGSWNIESVGMVGMDRNKLEQYITSIGAKSLGKSDNGHSLFRGY